jgi:hypothetical protein
MEEVIVARAVLIDLTGRRALESEQDAPNLRLKPDIRGVRRQRTSTIQFAPSRQPEGQ